MWRAEDPQGNESAKVRHELVPYLGGRCLDLGCGSEKVWPHFIGIDNYKDRKLFGTNVQANLKVETCEKLPIFGDEHFDCVFSSHLLEHIVDYKATLREWWRLVKPGGTLILYLPHRDHYPHIGTPGANPDHQHDFAPDDIITAMNHVPRGWNLERNETRSHANEYSFLQVFRKRTDGERLHAWKTTPEKTAAVVRLGNLGDALWSSSICAHLWALGYHVTLYTGEAGELVLKHDPHVDRIIVVPPVYDALGLISFFLYEAPKYDRFENLIGIVETRLLPAESDVEFWRTDAQRARMFDVNYLEALHSACGLPMDFRQKYYPTKDERARALLDHAALEGPTVVINPTGSTPSKRYPHVQLLIDCLEAAGLCPVVLGDIKGETYHTKRGRIVGMDWPIRRALAFALASPIVIGTESAIVNAVAFEPNFKLVLLSHSSHENLTKHWKNTIAIEPKTVPCFPCHRIHRTLEHCSVDESTKASACQSAIAPAELVRLVTEHLSQRTDQRAAA